MYPITVYPAIDGAFPPASFFEPVDALEYAQQYGGAVACSAFHYDQWRSEPGYPQVQLAMEFMLP